MDVCERDDGSPHIFGDCTNPRCRHQGTRGCQVHHDHVITPEAIEDDVGFLNVAFPDSGRRPTPFRRQVAVMGEAMGGRSAQRQRDFGEVPGDELEEAFDATQRRDEEVAEHGPESLTETPLAPELSDDGQAARDAADVVAEAAAGSDAAQEEEGT